MAISLTRKSKDDDTVQAEKSPRESKVKAPKGGAGKASRGRKFVLIIGDEGAILIFMHGSKVVRRMFAPSPQPSHSEAMMEIMRAQPAVPLTILADVIDQQYVPQNFPPVSKLSVGGLVKRRLERDFQPDDLTGALQLGRDKAGRKEWRYLLISLAKTPLVSEWIDLLVELPNQLKGIYLVPVEAANYVNQLAKKRGGALRPWQLLISHNKVSGFRQVVMQNGKLIFTRVSQAIDDAIPAVIAGNVEQEIINTVEYLKRLEFRDSADLDATVIISQDVIDTLDLNRFNFASAEALTPLAVAERLNLEQAALSADRFGDVVMAAAFGATKKRGLRFSNAYVEKLSKLYLATIGIKIVTALVVLVLVGLIGTTAADIIGDYHHIGDTEYKSQQQKPELTSTQKAVNGLNQNVAYKSAVVATYDAYVKSDMTPESFAAGIAPFNSIKSRLTEFDWEVAEDSAAKPGTASAPAATKDALPLTAKVLIDFSGSGTTLDVVDKSANELLESIKQAFPLYAVTAELPWQKEEAAHNEEVAVEVNSPSSIVVNNPVGIFNFRGIKKATPATNAAAPGVAVPGARPLPGQPVPSSPPGAFGAPLPGGGQ